MGLGAVSRAALGGASVAAATPGRWDGGFIAAVVHAGAAEQAVMAVLAAFSVAGWAVTLHKGRVLGRARRQDARFLEAFWASKRLDTIYQKAESFPDSPVAAVFRAGYVELAKIKKSRGEQARPEPDGHDLGSVERALGRAASHALDGLESGAGVLATCGSTAPFIGLFGTVLGMISVLTQMGAQGNANLTTVAPGIGGALVATAFGLLAAIPAVIFYNLFLGRLRSAELRLENFAADFLNIVKRHFF